MDPCSAASLALAIGAACKDVCTIGKFIYKKIQSAAHHEEEKKSMAEDFYLEFLKLESFEVWFDRSRGMITADSDLNEVCSTFNIGIHCFSLDKDRLTKGVSLVMAAGY